MAVSFTQRTLDRSLTAPWLKVTGDVTGDGRADIVVGDNQKGGLYLYRGSDFAKTTIAPTSKKFITDGAVADIDRDGRDDVVAIREGGLEWYKNSSWAATSIADEVLHDVEVADLDDDGRLDIVGRNQGSDGNKVYVYTQNAPSSWSLKTLSAPAGEGLLVRDLDRDGDPDVAINQKWYQNNGSGDFTQRTYTSAYSWKDTFIAAGDINRDGRVDLLASPAEAAGGTYRISWFQAPGNATGTWTEKVIASSVESVIHTLETADFDGDGDLDVLFAEMSQSSGDDEVGVYLNNGNGASWTKQVIDTNGSHSMQVLDANKDGKPDFVGANWRGNGRDTHVKLWLNDTDSDPGEPPPSGSSPFTNGADRLDLNTIELADYDQTTDALGGNDVVTLSETENVGVPFTGGAGNDQITGSSKTDTIQGGDGSDILQGRNGADGLLGEAGADRLRGEGGNDRLVGGGGADTSTGGGGNDRFVFRGSAFGDDKIADFSSGSDRIELAETRLASGTALTGFGQLDTSGDDRLSAEDAALDLDGNDLVLTLQGGSVTFEDIGQILRADVLFA